MFEPDKKVSKINVEIEVHLDDGNLFLGMVSVRLGQRVYRTRFLGHKFVSCGGPE